MVMRIQKDRIGGEGNLHLLIEPLKEQAGQGRAEDGKSQHGAEGGTGTHRGDEYRGLADQIHDVPGFFIAFSGTALGLAVIDAGKGSFGCGKQPRKHQQKQNAVSAG